LPVTPSMSGEDAKWIEVWARCAGVFRKGRTTWPINPKNQAWSSAPKSVRTKPDRCQLERQRHAVEVAAEIGDQLLGIARPSQGDGSLVIDSMGCGTYWSR